MYMLMGIRLKGNTWSISGPMGTVRVHPDLTVHPDLGLLLQDHQLLKKYSPGHDGSVLNLDQFCDQIKTK